MRSAGLLAALVLPLLAQEPGSGQTPEIVDGVPTFGVSVVLSAGLAGQIYAVKENTKKLPDFKKLRPIGVIYTYSLAVPPRDFDEGFPGIADRVEWFAIDYTGRFWVEQAGEYEFFLNSDDGSRLYIDGKRIINNDGQHPPEEVAGKVKLSRGVHNVRVSYFQGPRYHVALTLEVAPPGGGRRIFDLREFKPPAEFVEPEAKEAEVGP